MDAGFYFGYFFLLAYMGYFLLKNLHILNLIQFC